MARKQDKNLIPQAHKISVEEASKGGKKSGEVRKRKKTIGNILKQWSNFAVSENTAAKLKAMGFDDEDCVNITLVATKLIEKMKNGDLKAMEMFIKLTGQDNETEARIAKAKAEKKLVQAETEKLRQQVGDDREVESLTGLAEMLKINETDTDD